MSKIAIITARGGSKRIPEKNIRNFLGNPIITYSIKAAQDSGLFDEIMVSTDNAEIADIARTNNAEVPFMRSDEQSSDIATLADVVSEVLRDYGLQGRNYDYFCCILPTAPLINKKHLMQASEMVESGNYDAVVPVVEYSHPIQRSLCSESNGFLKMRWPENMSVRSQDLQPSYHDSGQFYFLKTKSFLDHRVLFPAKTGPIFLKQYEAQDIDHEDDWIIAEVKYKVLHNL